MMLVDSHCHLDCLDLTKYNNDLVQALNYAEQEGVGHFLCVCITLDHFYSMVKRIEPFSNVMVTAGHHPNEPNNNLSVNDILKYAQHPRVIGIGETGLDYFRSQGDLEWQHTRFRNHIRAAIEINKPLIVHTRDAREDTIRILQEEGAERVGGIMHCFTETLEMAQQAMDLGFYISFSGIVTFPNAQELRAVAREIPLDRMLVETDSPYLAPVPYRGKPNEPAYVKYVAEELALLKEESLARFTTQTTENFFNLFKKAKMT